MTRRAWVLASDKFQTDLAYALMDKIKKISKYPVFFGAASDGWFDKPSAVVEALYYYDQVCWLDNDLEILQNFDDIFEKIKTEIAGVSDYLYPSVYNAGVLVFTKEVRELVINWEALTQTKLFRSDQEALDIIRQQNSKYFSELPMQYNHQKWAIKNGINPNNSTRIIHWTGEEGKSYLRNKLGLNSSSSV